MTLYELTNEFRQLTETWDDSKTDDEVMELLTNLNQEFSEKIKNCAFYIKNLTGNVAAIDAEIKRLQDRKKAATNKIDRLKDYMKINMEELQQKGYDFDIISVKIQNNPPKVIVENEALIPAEYHDIKMVDTINKKAIKEVGGCPGAIIVQETSVRIK